MHVTTCKKDWGKFKLHVPTNLFTVKETPSPVPSEFQARWFSEPKHSQGVFYSLLTGRRANESTSRSRHVLWDLTATVTSETLLHENLNIYSSGSGFIVSLQVHQAWYVQKILIVVYVFLLLSMYSYCSSMYSYRCLCILTVVYVFLLFVRVFLSLYMYSYCYLWILIVRSCILIVVYVFLSLSMYSYCCLCILIVVYVFLLFVHVFLPLSMYSYCCLCILIVRPCILIVVYVFLLLSMYSYCSSMYSYCCLCIIIVRPCILIVVYVYLLLSMYS